MDYIGDRFICYFDIIYAPSTGNIEKVKSRDYIHNFLLEG